MTKFIVLYRGNPVHFGRVGRWSKIWSVVPQDQATHFDSLAAAVNAVTFYHVDEPNSVQPIEINQPQPSHS